MNTKLLRLVNKYGWQRTWPIYHQLANRKAAATSDGDPLYFVFQL